MNGVYPDDERREYRRLKVNITVIYRVDRPLKVRMQIRDREVEATIMDLSEGGIAILTKYYIPMSSLLLIKFMLYRIDRARNFKLYKSINVKGKVRYNIFLGENKYRLGICFKELDEENRSLIAEFVKVANIPANYNL